MQHNNMAGESGNAESSGLGFFGWLGLAAVAVVGLQVATEVRTLHRRKKLDEWTDRYEKRTGETVRRHWHARRDSIRGAPLPR